MLIHGDAFLFSHEMTIERLYSSASAWYGLLMVGRDFIFDDDIDVDEYF